MHRVRVVSALIHSPRRGLGCRRGDGWTGWMIYTYSQVRVGHTAREVTEAVAAGRLERAGRFYALPGTDDSFVGPLRRGARATCLVAARHHGLWTPPGAGRHVYTRRGPHIPAAWIPHGFHRAWPEEDPIASPGLLLEHACRCLDPLHVGILADSALHLGKLDEAEVAAIARRAPREVRRVLALVDGRAESGTESKVRLRLQLDRVPVRPQVKIEGVGRVDLLVGERWIVECDSKAHHTAKKSYEKDRGRDFNASRLGYQTSRLTYDMCFTGWDDTVGWLAGMVATGHHLVSPEEWRRARRRR